jgi:hypothetical protein
MTEQIRFLRDAAAKLRELAATAPEVSEQLRALAAELETEVRRLEGLQPRRH